MFSGACANSNLLLESQEGLKRTPSAAGSTYTACAPLESQEGLKQQPRGCRGQHGLGGARISRRVETTFSIQAPTAVGYQTLESQEGLKRSTQHVRCGSTILSPLESQEGLKQLRLRVSQRSL